MDERKRSQIMQPIVMREDKDIGDPNDVVLRIVAPSLLSIIKLLGNLLSERDNSYVFSIPL